MNNKQFLIMPILIAVFMLIISVNWLFTNILATIPLNLLNSLGSLFWACVGLLLLVILGWFFGD